MTRPEILLRLKRVHRSGNGNCTACCPAHDDQNPSLSIWERENRIFFKCHAGCTEEAVLKALGLSKQDLYQSSRSTPKANKSKSRFGKVVKTYIYEDADGNPAFYVERSETSSSAKGATRMARGCWG